VKIYKLYGRKMMLNPGTEEQMMFCIASVASDAVAWLYIDRKPALGGGTG